jgi:hypothetical protein
MTITTSPAATTTTVPPHNLEAERSVLGAVLLTPVWLNRITLPTEQQSVPAEWRASG